MSANENRRAANSTASNDLAGSTTDYRASADIWAELHAAESALEAVWERLATAELSLAELHEKSWPTFAIHMLAFDSGIAAKAEHDARAVRQAEADADRLYLRSFNDADRAAEIERRLDRQIAMCPPHIEPHTADYWEWALSAVFAGGAR